MSKRREDFPIDRHHDPLEISRRSFLIGGGAGVASLLLPCLGVFGNGIAYALDASASGDDSEVDPTADIIVLSITEIGFYVYDVSESGATSAVSGAEVELSTLDGKVAFRAISDELGAVVFDINNLGEVVDYGSLGTRYRLEAKAKITNGNEYRLITIEKMLVESGEAYGIPCCRKTGEHDPYFESMSFAGWDIQYTSYEAIRQSVDKNEVPISGTLRMEGVDKATVSLRSRAKTGDKNLDDKVLFSVSVDFEKGVGSFSKSARYLYQSISSKNSDLLPIDRTFEFHVLPEGAASPNIFETNLVVFDAPLPKVETGNASLVPSTSFSFQDLVTVPDSVFPPLGGSTLSVWWPTLPVCFFISPFGYLFFGIGVTAEKSGESMDAFKQDKMSMLSRWNAGDQLDKLYSKYDDQKKKYSQVRSAMDSKSSKVSAGQMSRSISFNMSIQAQALLKLDWLNWLADEEKAKQIEGMLALIAELGISFAVTWPFYVGPVPFFVQIAVDASARFSANMGLTSPLEKPLNVSVNKTATELAFVFPVKLTLSLGVGFSGILSASVDGSGSLTTYVAIKELAAPEEPPHVILSLVAGLYISLQAVIFKWSGKIVEYSDPRLYDNWPNNNAADGVLSSLPPRFALMEEGSEAEACSFDVSSTVGAADGSSGSGQVLVSLSEFYQKAQIVTSDELLGTRELEASKKTSASSSTAAEASVTELPGNMYSRDLDVSPLALGANEEDEGDGYAYEYVGEDPEGYCGDDPRVSGFHDEGGVIPSKDVKIVGNSFSNPAAKVVTYDGRAYLFRIASVDYDGQGRTVLIAQIYNDDTGRWGRPQALEIPISVAGVSRADLFDYDFDVRPFSESDTMGSLYQGLYVIIVSGLRRNGDSTSFAEASTSSVITVAVLNRNLKRLVSTAWSTDPDTGADAVYAVSCPRIVDLWQNGHPRCIAACYLRHQAATAEEVFTESAHTTVQIAAINMTKLLHIGQVEVDSTTVDLKVSSINNGAQNEASGQSVNKGSFALYAISSKGMRIATVTLSLNLAADQSGSAEDSVESGSSVGEASSYYSFESVINVMRAQNVGDMQPWPGHSSFLTVQDGKLHESSFNPDVFDGSMTTRAIGPDNYDLSSFKISANGNVLFFTSNFSGVVRMDYDDQGNPTPVTSEDHTVMASLYKDGLFSKPFPIARTDHPLDAIAGISGRSVYSFVATAITSLANSSADMHYIEVPVTAAASVQGLIPEIPMVTQGEEATFAVVLRNEGNVILTGCTATYYDAETGEKFGESRVEFTAENTCASVWNPELEEDPDEAAVANARVYSEETLAALGIEDGHVLADPVSQGSLLPGDTAQYRSTVTIPTSWHGKKSVRVTLGAFSYDTVVSAAPGNAGDAEPEPLSFALGPDHSDVPQAEIGVNEISAEAFAQVLSMPGAVIVREDGSAETIDGNGSADDANGSDSGGVLSKLSSTGDGLGALGAAGLLAGAAAAGFAAYSARRTAIENEANIDGE